MKKYPLIRTIYLYLFSMLGLVLLVIGTVQLFNIGLKALVFTQAEEQQRMWQMDRPYYDGMIKEVAVDVDEAEEGEEVCLSEEEKEDLDQWLVEYEAWEEESGSVDPVVADRHRNLAMALSLILVGFPLFLFHWLIIRKENKG